MNCDAVIVLANEMDKDGVLNKESSLRANLAAQMARDYKIPFVITCGWAYRADSDVKIADAFKSYIVKLGVRAEQILTEENSRDTVGDAVFTRLNLVEPLGLRKFYVVTSNYHVPRTTKVFNFVPALYPFIKFLSLSPIESSKNANNAEVSLNTVSGLSI